MTEVKELNTKQDIVKFLEWLNYDGYIMDFDYEQIAESYLGNRKPIDAIKLLSHYHRYTSKDITMAFNEVLEYLDNIE